MRELFEFRVPVRREHFRVRVNVDAGVRGLLEKFFQVEEVVSGNQNPGARSDADVDRRSLRRPEGRRIRLVEKRRRFDRDRTAFEREGDQLVDARLSGDRRERFADERVNFVVLEPENRRVFGVSGDALDAVSNQLFERANVFVLLRQHAERNVDSRRFAAVADERTRLGELRFERGRVEVGVGDRREERFNEKTPDFAVDGAGQRDFFQFGDQKVLQVGDFGGFSANADAGAALAAARFLALEAKHRDFLRNIQFFNLFKTKRDSFG